MYVELRQDYALTCFATVAVDFSDAIEHQHVINR
jgi:hypothetical protein